MLAIDAYEVHVWIIVLCLGQEAGSELNSLITDLDRCKSSNVILFKGELKQLQSNENTLSKTVCFVYIDFMTQ